MKACLTTRARAAAGAAAASGNIFVSTNDAVVVFVWMLMRRLRRESLGGSGARRGWLGCMGASTADAEVGLEGFCTLNHFKSMLEAPGSTA